jgi:enterochelin esterase-like enzyme
VGRSGEVEKSLEVIERYKELHMRSAPVVLRMLFLLAGGWLACSPASAEEKWVNPPGKQKWPAGCRHETFHSDSMNIKVGYNIYLPPDYEKSDRRFPVIYWLHGYGGNESYYAYPTFVGTLAEGVKSKKVPPCICVFVNAGKSSWYADGKDGKVMGETVVIKELIPLIDKTYRTIATREGRALQGASMGGFGALKFAFKYPEMFSSVMAYCPALWEWPQDEEMRKSLKQNLKKISGKVGLRIVVGEEDHLDKHLSNNPELHRFVENNRKLHDLMDELKVPHEYLELPKIGHDGMKLFQKVGLVGFQFNADHFGDGKGDKIDLKPR